LHITTHIQLTEMTKDIKNSSL